MLYYSGFNVNFNIAEAAGYFPKSWIRDGVYARSCPPKCPSLKKSKGKKAKDTANTDNNDKIFQIDMESLLRNIDDQDNLTLWLARETWKTNNNKKYVEEDCPSFKEMKDKDIYDNMEHIVQKLVKGNFLK